jgi:hypothetical protein
MTRTEVNLQVQGIGPNIKMSGWFWPLVAGNNNGNLRRLSDRYQRKQTTGISVQNSPGRRRSEVYEQMPTSPIDGGTGQGDFA